MALKRVRVTHLPSQGEAVALSAEAAHHLVDVLRLTDGTAVQAFDGDGGRADGTLQADGEGWSFVATSPPLRSDRTRLHLVLGLPKGPAADLAFRMATELGVTDLHPVLAAHSVKQRPKPDRWARILTSAAQQCRRDDEPTLWPTADLATILGRLDGVQLTVAHPDGQPLPAAEGPVALFIGPEGGWSSAEVAQLEAAGAHRLSLGPTILRTPTAVAAGLARIHPALRA